MRSVRPRPFASPAGDPSGLAVAATRRRAPDAESLEEAAFRSGAALAALRCGLGQPGLALPLLRERLALAAAVACVGLSGRSETMADLRDAINFLRPGDQPGPAGAIYQHWRRAVGRPLPKAALHRILPAGLAGPAALVLEPGRGSPVVQAAAVIERMLAEDARDAVPALILADAVLSRAMGWDHLVPLLAEGLKPRDLHKVGYPLRLACHHAAAVTAARAIGRAQDLTRRTALLQMVAPQLRARGADAAVALFLARDAIAPAGLCAVLPDRAARRLCDRLVALGAVQELTGRDSFRLYGV